MLGCISPPVRGPSLVPVRNLKALTMEWRGISAERSDFAAPCSSAPVTAKILPNHNRCIGRVGREMGFVRLFHASIHDTTDCGISHFAPVQHEVYRQNEAPSHDWDVVCGSCDEHSEGPSTEVSTQDSTWSNLHGSIR